MHPKFKITPTVLKKVTQGAMKGLDEASIARLIKLHPSTFSEKKKTHPELAEALEKGRSLGQDTVTTLLWDYHILEKKNLNAIQFYLTRKCGWKEAAQDVQVIEAPSGFNFRKVG